MDKHTFFLFHCWRRGFNSVSLLKISFSAEKRFFVSHMEKHTLSWFHSWKKKKLKKRFYLVSEKVFFYWFTSVKTLFLFVSLLKIFFFLYSKLMRHQTKILFFHKKMKDKVLMFISDLSDCWQRQILTSGSAGQSFCRITVPVFLERKQRVL